MLLRPAPLPDEFIRGYIGRLGRFNGVASEKELFDLLAAWAGFGTWPRRKLAWADVLSMVAGSEVGEFVREHTMIPLRRGITGKQPYYDHGSKETHSIVMSTELYLARKGAYLCACCIEEDLNFHGQSSWRREHQTPGLYWCPKHGCRLRLVGDSSAYLRSPASCLDESHAVDGAWVTTAKQSTLVQRYLDLCSWLMSRRTPVGLERASAILRARAAAKGLRYRCRNDIGGLLTEKVVSATGGKWLLTVVPRTAKDRELGLEDANDDDIRLLRPTSAACTLVLAAAILFETTDEAANALSTADVTDLLEQQRRDNISNVALFRTYIDADGSYARTADTFSVDRQYIERRLRVSGLPNSDEIGHGQIFAAARSLFAGCVDLSRNPQDTYLVIKEMQNMLRYVGRRTGQPARVPWRPALVF